MKIVYPNCADIIGYNCYNKKEPFYLQKSIDFNISYSRYLKSFHIPLGFTSDGCTLKLKILWLIIGCPHTPEFVIPSIIHDYFCKNKYLIDRETASEVFEKMLINEGVKESKAKRMRFWMNIYQKYCNNWM